MSGRTSTRPGQRIGIPSVPNLRDIGGYRTSGGRRVRTGFLYRSVELNHLQDEDLEPGSVASTPGAAFPRNDAAQRRGRDSNPRRTFVGTYAISSRAP
jgi:hypothetical protein